MYSTDPHTLWTIGHSTRAWEVFVTMLRGPGIVRLVDVRRFAGSRRNPQFSGQDMGKALAAEGIGYEPMPALGGRRTPRTDSPNGAWRNASFRGYADYMQTGEYQAARQRLQDLARTGPVAIMCAEAMWWQCHRSLIADDFKVDGWTVLHLLAAGRQQEHPYTSAARIVDGRLDYGMPAGEQAQLF